MAKKIQNNPSLKILMNSMRAIGYSFKTATDMGDVLLTDYASCGKKWSEENARISVWFKPK